MVRRALGIDSGNVLLEKKRDTRRWGTKLESSEKSQSPKNLEAQCATKPEARGAGPAGEFTVRSGPWNAGRVKDSNVRRDNKARYATAENETLI